MLGCHDGIPVLDLKGKDVNGNYNRGLLSDQEIEHIMDVVLERGGRVKIYMVQMVRRFLTIR